jgi:ATP-dependent protease ClpP protease subunit
MEGYTVDFNSNDKDEVIEMVLNTPGGQQKAPRKK